MVASDTGRLAPELSRDTRFRRSSWRAVEASGARASSWSISLPPPPFPGIGSRALTARVSKSDDQGIADRSGRTRWHIKGRLGPLAQPRPLPFSHNEHARHDAAPTVCRQARCLNTLLRNAKPPVFCSRTCRIDTIKEKGLDYVKGLGLQNVKDMLTIIRWNEENNIRFMRMSSEMFPFASHDIYGYSLEYASGELAEVGALAKQLGHRLTMHPGQFNQLGSPKEDVVRRTIKDLEYHAEVMDRMGLPPDSIMIIHMGGVYGDKAATIRRFEQNYSRLPPHIKARLVIENDEICYSVADLLPVCQRLSIPLVLDWHHHALNTGGIEDILPLIPDINETWSRKKLKPKQHYSESRPNAQTVMERRAHSDRVEGLPPCQPDMDLMIEAKDKEQAVLQLYQKFGLFEVAEENRIVKPRDKQLHSDDNQKRKSMDSENRGRRQRAETKKRKVTMLSEEGPGGKRVQKVAVVAEREQRTVRSSRRIAAKQ
ncbi:uncharacterized protein VTP21DRAFT_6221 [Calcarisporiella thermophila]|uniref:uncharacterized protein n=1 Tax=Calcarisporiella thermophila TaxID=911321 RepID=UPI00374410DB